MNSFASDLRYGIRMLRKRAGYTLLAVFTLALGAGANISIFTIVNAALLEPFPYRQPDDLVMVWQSYPERGIDRYVLSPADFLDYDEQCQLLEGIAAYETAGFDLTGSERAERLIGLSVSPNIFDVLGVRPLLGTGFEAVHGKPGSEHEVILSHDLWQRLFGADSNVTGRAVTLNGESYTVAGVMPRNFNFPPPMTLAGRTYVIKSEVWVPLTLDRTATSRAEHRLSAVARVGPGVELESALAEIQTVAARLEQQYPETNSGAGIALIPIKEQAIEHIRLALFLLLGAAAAVLLIACANLASFQLAQSLSRRKEFVIRNALGATRGRLVRQLLTESLLLSFGAGLAGLAIARLSLPALMALTSEDVQYFTPTVVAGNVLAFTLALSLAVGLVLGLLPALQVRRCSPVEGLRETPRTQIGGQRTKLLWNTLVVAEVAVALVLLLGAATFLQSFSRIVGTDLGFAENDVLTMQVSMPRSRYPNAAAVTRFQKQLIDELNSLPSVRAAGVVNPLPLSGGRSTVGVLIEGQQNAGGTEEQSLVEFQVASAGLFDALAIPLLVGRDFGEFDTLEAPPVVIINRSLWKLYLPSDDPIGKRIRMGPDQPWLGVVGVVEDVRNYRVQDKPMPQIYLPYSQFPQRNLSVVVRTDRDPASLKNAVASRVVALDSEMPVAAMKPMSQMVSEATSQPRFRTTLLAVGSGLALLLAIAGIYGVLSYSTRQRAREIGIRMAIGAEPRRILTGILKEGLLQALLGVIIGISIAYTLIRLISGVIADVGPAEPALLVGVSIFMLGAAAAACYFSARRSMRVDPAITLKQE
jgi:putative ABC transport system permease protein